MGGLPDNIPGTVPEQIVWSGLITPTTKVGLKLMVNGLDVAGEPVRHGEAFEVITTVITSPSARAEEA